MDVEDVGNCSLAKVDSGALVPGFDFGVESVYYSLCDVNNEEQERTGKIIILGKKE